MYEKLDAAEILRTAERLEQRIMERFPTASLSKLAARLVAIIRDCIREVTQLRRPNIWLRMGVGVFLAAGLSVLLLAVPHFHVSYRLNGISELIQTIESTLGILFFLSTGVFFFVKLEDRIKRSRILSVVHNLRTVAHIVDMHQLTKEPEAVMMGVSPTASSPVRALNEIELRRYLDYSSELLALLSKVAALYAEGFADPVVLDAVDDLEDLTAGLIGKIWQKIVIMDRWKVGGGAVSNTPELS
jgi:hypothetical protein